MRLRKEIKIVILCTLFTSAIFNVINNIKLNNKVVALTETVQKLEKTNQDMKLQIAKANDNIKAMQTTNNN